MTGFGRATFVVGESDFFVEISSVNQRGFALGISVPADWQSAGAERLLAPIIREKIARGKISLAIKTNVPAENSGTGVLFWDEAGVAVAIEKLRAQAKKQGIAFEVSSEIYLRLAEIHRKKSQTLPSLEDESVAGTVIAGTQEALEKFIAMREKEGSFLKTDLLARVEKLRMLAAQIKKKSAGTVENFRDALLARLKTLNLEIDASDERFIKEATIFADRCDISEELTRLESHFSQFEACLDEAESGRKLDFICQEILREFNTIGSKANNIDVTRCVVEAKNEQERMREQVQNIE